MATFPENEQSSVMHRLQTNLAPSSARLQESPGDGRHRQIHIPSFNGFNEDQGSTPSSAATVDHRNPHAPPPPPPPPPPLPPTYHNTSAYNLGDQSSSSSDGVLRIGIDHTTAITPDDVSTSKSLDDDSTQAPPAWTEMKTKAGKDRKRLPLACIACRRKKIRCSGEHPACKHCIRSRIPCVYKVTTRKAAPRTDYMAMLDRRLKRMEDRVIRVLPKEQHGIVTSTGRAVLRTSVTPSLRRNSTSSKKRAAEQSVAELEQWSKDDEQRRPLGKQSPSVNATSSQNTSTRSQELDEQSLLTEGIDKLPPKDVREHLAEVFFDFVYGQSYHLLHKPSFMRRLAQDQVAPVLLLAVCAMAARFSNHPAVRTEPAFLRGEEWAAAAREIALKRYDSPNITILIVYLILTLHEFGTCQGGRSWMFGGMAQRMAYALQLHQDLLYDPQQLALGKKVEFSFTDREIRRRVMWACFLMDRFCSSGTERPMFVGTEHIRARLPVAERLFIREIQGCTEDLAGNVHDADIPDGNDALNAKENMGVAAYTIRAIEIWGHAINYHNLGGKGKDRHPIWDDRSDFHKLRLEIRAWDENLPEQLRFTADNLAAHATEKISNQFVFMHIIHNQTVLFINRFALPSPSSKLKTAERMPTAFLKECAKSAWTAANKVSVLVREGMAHNVVAPFAGYSAFFSGAVHIHGTFSRNESLQASSKQHLTWNINYLTKMKKHWGMFHFMTENLRDLHKKLANHSRNAAQPDSTESDAIFQYGDWFDRYPHGVSGASYSSPQVEPRSEPGADAGLGQQGDLHTVEDFFANLGSSASGAPSALPVTKPRKQSKRRVSSHDSAETGEEVMSHSRSSPYPALQQGISASMQDDSAQAQATVTPNYPFGVSTVMDEAYELGSATYLDTPTVMNSMTGYQAELTQLANSAINPLMSGMNMAFGASGIPIMSLDDNPYNGSTSGAWFMPYNVDPPSVPQVTNNFSGGNVAWPASFGGIQDPEMGLNPTLDLNGSQHVLNSGQNGSI